jgi:nucleoside-diphosphate-sugar epimerase
MQIVVTGATGFIGSHFAQHAVAAGHNVVGMYRSGRKPGIRQQLAHSGVQLRKADILDRATLPAVMQGADCVCHFAAAFKESGVDDDYFRRHNVDGTVNTLEAAANAGVRRFIHCSTAGIYGRELKGTTDESAEPRPLNIYEETKLAAERQLRSRAPRLGIEYVILRPTAVYGPRDDRLLKLFRSAAKGRFPLFGKGDGRRHMVYVTDLAEAFLRACTAPAAASKGMIIGGPRAVPLREMLERLAVVVDRRKCGPRLPLKPMLLLAAATEDVCNRIGIQPPIYRRRMDFYLSDAAFSSKLADEVLGWQPQVGLREGLQKTFAAYCDSGQIDGLSRSGRAVAARSTAFWSAVQFGEGVLESGGFLLL